MYQKFDEIHHQTTGTSHHLQLRSAGVDFVESLRQLQTLVANGLQPELAVLALSVPAMELFLKLYKKLYKNIGKRAAIPIGLLNHVAMIHKLKYTYCYTGIVG